MSAFQKLTALLLKRVALTGLFFSSVVMAQPAIEGIEFTSLAGDRVQIDLDFSATPPQPEVFMIENPARLAMDFNNVISNLGESRYQLNMGSAESVVVLESQGRTRMVVNLTDPTAYTMTTAGTSMRVIVGNDVGNAATAQVMAAAQGSVTPSQQGAARSGATQGDIRGVDFRRSESGAGQIIIDLSSNDLIGSVNRSGTQLELEFLNAELDDALRSRLDVIDFATPVQFVNVYSENGSVLVVAEVTGDFDYLAYQTSGQYVLSISPVMAAQAGSVDDEFSFTGERISLNFQNIDVRTVLQILADFNDFSLVVSDTVSGNITLRLIEVPWDQALDLVLRARGLGQRLVGSVLYIAPADEIAAFELQRLESDQQVESLAPLVTEYIPVNYAIAQDLLNLLQGAAGGAGGILSERGRATVDQRTNTLIVQDVASNIEGVRSMLARLDVPVRQVQIEARIVNASTSFSDALGVRWGGVQTFPSLGEEFILGGSINSTTQLSSNIAAFNQAVAEAVAGGASLDEALATTPRASVDIGDALVVDLGVQGADSSIALGYLGSNGLLQLELSALEASGNGEVIAQPKVATQDKQLARIESGVQIPYQAQAGGTAGGSTTEFVTAALSLEVTPQITPDNRIIMLLDIHQDSVVPGSGGVPAIATNSVTTRVLVEDGETVVLGGVFREETTTSVSKTPVLGDIPYLGLLFKRTEDSETKTELLIFITPSIINDVL